MSGEAGKRALVTGSVGGIGRAVVARLRSEGFEVVGVDRSPGADIVVDLASEPLPPEAAEVDICVSNAGITDVLSPAHRMSPEKWERDLATNLTASFRVVQACLAGMLERRYGRIVAISSLAAAVGSPGQVAYSASKAGLVGMIRTIAVEGAPRGVTANAVLPGLIGTDSVLGMPAEVLARLRERFLPMGRMGSPEELAALVAYLSSEEAGYLTGQAIVFDGASSLNSVSLGRDGES